KFPLKSSKHPQLSKTENTFAVIWTTTPWTLPANLAISVHPEFEYDLFTNAEGERWLLATGLKDAFEKETSVSVKPSGLKLVGKDLEGTIASHPFYDRPSPFLLGEHVTLEAGTGLVHTAPGHGQDDYIVGLKYGLKPYSPVDERGLFTADVPEYQGMKIWDANPKVIERLKDLGRLIFFKEFEHAYPSNWRTKTPLIFRATPQWFLAMDHESYNIRAMALSAIKENVQWIPKWGENRITGMISARPDWCLSRQRTWGVPIPVFYCEKCGKELASEAVMNRIADKMETGGGIEAFWDHAPTEFTQGEACGKCGDKNFKRGNDILDVWFDSGICFAAVHSKRDGLQSPADLYLEGSDQHRGWFHTSLLASIAQDGKAPYKKVLTHGFVLYDKGVKMSKSTGLSVDPQDIISKSGAEILRLWAAHEDYANDLTAKPENFERIAETYRRLRNTARYLLGNLSDFDLGKDGIALDQLRPVDQWALSRLNVLITTVKEAYESYEFHKVYHALNNFVTVELSSQYLDLLKDILYTGKKTGHARRSAQTVMHHLLWNLMGLMAPIATFLPEEILEHMKGTKPESMLLTDFPQPKPKWVRKDLEEKFEVIFKVRSIGQKKLEELRAAKTIGSSLEGKLTITAPADDLKVLQSWRTDLPMLMIVSEVVLKEGHELDVHAEKAGGQKCERCWSYQSTVGVSAQFPGACHKCVEALT
ncbi:MAG: class I tRNA ligase family protein, partial [Bdellovibrionales bacterium]|nr:class I tRNA ligase family protein [Bdellovibrionales bacterium]